MREPGVVLAFPGMVGEREAVRFSRPLHVCSAMETAQVVGVLRQAERWAAEGMHVAGWVSYEAAPAFDSVMRVRPPVPSDPPLAWFAASPSIERFQLPRPTSPAASAWTIDDPAEHYAACVGDIRNRIASGDVYQVNYTTRLRSTIAEDSIALLARLSAAQRDSYSALLDGGTHRIVSVSPELFFEKDGDRIVTKPMKGTSPRGRWPDEDARLARDLAASEKERAENVMIVDLLRNDLGRIAVPGTVRVSRLFDVEQYDTVWQMTSTIEARLMPDATLPDCFAALFPCGSVTGAPKIAAMKVIAELESSSRGVYCGAIGYIAPGGRATFSVAIRTLVQHYGTGAAVYGAGGGITWDSLPDAEYDEMRTKARVLTREPREFALLETLRLENGVVARRDRHLARLRASSKYFGFAEPRRAAEELQRAASAAPNGIYRLRLTADRAGCVRVECRTFDWNPASESERVSLASEAVDRHDVLVYHKTTRREIYDRHRREAPDAFDVLLWNDRREATEFTFGNLVVERDGALLTPALECGLLPGTFRAELLDAGTIREAVIPLDSLGAASRIWLVNSLRGWVPVRLTAPDAA